MCRGCGYTPKELREMSTEASFKHAVLDYFKGDKAQHAKYADKIWDLMSKYYSGEQIQRMLNNGALTFAMIESGIQEIDSQ